MLWAICIWELATITFVTKAALVTDALVPWWQLHLCDRSLTNDILPSLENMKHPEHHAQYWPTMRKLVAHGFPELALRLLKQHSTLRAGDRATDKDVMWPLLDGLETLLEYMPRLSDSSVTEPQIDDRPDPSEHALLRAFKRNHQTWSSDMRRLQHDAESAAQSSREAEQVASMARLLCGDSTEIDAVCDQWHGKLIATLLYQQPTTFRWQLPALVLTLMPNKGDAGPFQNVLLAILNDDPWAMLKGLRFVYGDGWLVAHLWDLLWRAGTVCYAPN